MRVSVLKSFIAGISLVFAPSSFCQSQASNTFSNGISVGAPKVFDNRTLTLMLQNLGETLHNTQFINQKTLATALGTEQGISSTDFSSNLTVSTLPTPGLKQEAISKVGGGQDTSQDTTTRTQASVSPAVPGLGAAATLPQGFNPQFGQSASDLLGDQVNLTYQIFNLQMLLERSLTDRLWSNKGELKRASRLQAVLGFNVTIDPPRKANDAVAVVEIKLKRNTSKDSEKQPDGALSLISLMPQEKTYNSAALSSKSHSFGGSAVVNLVQVGYAQSRKSKTFYLYRDTDTVSYEVTEGGEKGEIVFGWIFRPVLGRRSISPGLRQLFAIVALPDAENCEGDNPASPKPEKTLHCDPKLLNAEVRTYWKEYDGATLTAFQSKDANRASRFKFAASLSLAKPEILSPQYENKRSYDNIEVLHVEDYERALRPVVHGITWRPTGPNTALVSISGENFFTGTQLTIGGTLFTGSGGGDGMIIKSNQSIDLITSINTLAVGSGAVIGRYGVAAPLLDRTGQLISGGEFALQIADVRTSPILNGFSQGWITFKDRDAKSVSLKALRDALPRQSVTPGLHSSDKYNSTDKDNPTMVSEPIISLNGKAIPPPYSYVETTDDKVGAIQVNIPESYFSKGGGIIRVSWPFLPAEGWTRNQSTFDYTQAFKLSRLSSDWLFITDQGQLNLFERGSPCWYAVTNGTTFEIEAPDCIRDSRINKPTPLQLSGDGLLLKLPDAKAEKVVLFRKPATEPGGGESYSLDIPKTTDQTTKAPTSTIQVNQYDSTWITISADSGKVFPSKVFAEANGVKLNSRKPADAKPDDKATKIQVQMTRQVTKRPGTVEITISDAAGNPLASAKVTIASTVATDKASKTPASN